MNKKVFAAVVMAVLAVAGGVYFLKRPAPPPPPVQPVDPVRTVPLSFRKISKRVTAYGTVTGAPGDEWNVSKPFDTEIRDVYVRTGQRVKRGQALLRISAAPSAQLAFTRAKNALLLARQGLRQVQHRFALRLATNADLLAARQRYDSALIHWRSLSAWGVGGDALVRAPASGFVALLPVATPGALVPRAQTLVTVTANRHLQAAFGFEPSVAAALPVGRAVSVTSLNPGARPVVGHVVAVAGTIDPKTRLVNVFVTLPRTAGFLIGEFVRGRVNAYTDTGFVVPYSAVLPENGRRVLYTVQDGRAVAHTVHIELRDHRFYEISGDGLKAGDPVVVLGNYELHPGMPVQVTAR
ncbi:MAG: efflux RND transporter periplasmic adaptor subunit [Acidiferrobacteraceae bacterium]